MKYFATPELTPSLLSFPRLFLFFFGSQFSIRSSPRNVLSISGNRHTRTCSQEHVAKSKWIFDRGVAFASSIKPEARGKRKSIDVEWSAFFESYQSIHFRNFPFLHGAIHFRSSASLRFVFWEDIPVFRLCLTNYQFIAFPLSYHVHWKTLLFSIACNGFHRYFSVLAIYFGELMAATLYR